MTELITKKEKIIYAVTFFIVLLVMILVIVFRRSQGYEEDMTELQAGIESTAESFFTALDEGEVEEAKGYIAADAEVDPDFNLMDTERFKNAVLNGLGMSWENLTPKALEDLNRIGEYQKAGYIVTYEYTPGEILYDVENGVMTGTLTVKVQGNIDLFSLDFSEEIEAANDGLRAYAEEMAVDKQGDELRAAMLLYGAGLITSLDEDITPWLEYLPLMDRSYAAGVVKEEFLVRETEDVLSRMADRLEYEVYPVQEWKITFVPGISDEGTPMAKIIRIRTDADK